MTRFTSALKPIIFGSVSYISGIIIMLIGVEAVVMAAGDPVSSAPLIKMLPKFFGILLALAMVRIILRCAQYMVNPDITDAPEEERLEFYARKKIEKGGIIAVVGIATTVFVFLQYPVAGIITAICFAVTGGMINSTSSLDAYIPLESVEKEKAHVNRLNADMVRGLGEIIQYRRGDVVLEEMENRAEPLEDARAEFDAVRKNRVFLTNLSIMFFAIVLVGVMYVALREGRANVEETLLVLMASISSFGVLRNS